MTEIKQFTVTIQREMSWGQMDAFQHMNNIQYFRYFEDARIAYLEETGLYDAMDNRSSSIGPILASTSCTFKKPVQYPATLVAGSRVVELDDDRFMLEHGLAEQESNTLAAQGTAEIVTFNYETSNKTPVPTTWIEAIESIEGKTFTSN